MADMVIDVNAYIGHYPFRNTKYHTAAELIALMDKYGVGYCCVASLNAVYYSDCMKGNYELLKEIEPFKDRLLPFCVINPEYNCAMDDFKTCAGELGFAGLRLFPKQQGYRLDDDPALAMLALAGEMKMPAHIPILLEDLRGHHKLDISEPVGADEIKNAALMAPDTDFILSNAYLQTYSKIIEPECKNRGGKIFYDIGRVDCLFSMTIGDLAADCGYDRLVFGTGAMLQNIPVQFVKLHFIGETLGVTPEQIEGIKSGNIKELLLKNKHLLF